MYVLISGVLWSGAFVPWIGYLTRWRVQPIYWTECKLLAFLFYYFRHYFSSLLVVMSLERFFALYFPLKSKTVCTVKTAKWATTILALIFLAYNVQYLIIYKSQVKDRVYSCLFPNKKLLEVLDRIDSILYSFGTFTIMILVNSAIIVMFMKAKFQSIIGNSVESTSQALNKYAVGEQLW